MTVSDLASVVTSNVNICLHYADGTEEFGYSPDFYDNHDNIGFIDLQTKMVNGEEKTCIFAYVMPLL